MENKIGMRTVVVVVILAIAVFGYFKRAYIGMLFQHAFSSGKFVEAIPLSEDNPLLSASSVLSKKTGEQVAQKNIIQKVSITAPLINEIMIGKDGNAGYEFIELYNPHATAVNLTGFSVRKQNAVGIESPLVSAERLKDKIILSQAHFLLAHDNGYNGSTTPDVWWAKSNTIPMTTGSVVLYDSSGDRVEKVAWGTIPKNKSFVRVSWGSLEFVISNNPTPESSSGE